MAIASSWKELLRRPYSSCECVVRRGPVCSHQLCVLLLAVAIRIVMQRLPDKRWQQVKQHMPDYILVMQKMAMTVNYAYGAGSMGRFTSISPGHMTALLKVRAIPARASVPLIEDAITAAPVAAGVVTARRARMCVRGTLHRRR